MGTGGDALLLTPAGVSKVGLMTARFIHLYEIDGIIRKAGADRVGEDASEKLCELMEDTAKELIAKAKVLSRHAGRNQVTREDIRLAATLLYAL